ncbi:MAG: hypothetical protein K0Q49_177 [Haloplasmataceae bacterium]|jgi:hypothetical protein|nr:hypothetical protein [Haloplasmataceae bacterium]
MDIQNKIDKKNVNFFITIIIKIREKLLNIFLFFWHLSIEKKAAYLIVINSLYQLWISKYHIDAINNVFTTYIGVWLFAFIIFGFVALFNATRIHGNNSKILTIFFTLLTTAFGVVYVYIALSDNVLYEKIEKSMNYAYEGIAVYLLASIMLFISMIVNKKKNR